MLEFSIFTILFASVLLICLEIVPMVLKRLNHIFKRKTQQAQQQLENIFIPVKQERLFSFYVVIPIVAGGVGYLFFHNLVIVFLVIIAGVFLPKFIIKNLQVRRKAKFQSQLVDTLMLMASSLKAGLSLLQAIEVLTEEMPAPISDEFGLILRENKMGVTLEESFRRLNERMDIRELSLVINAILVARETGGDLTKVFSRLANTIRDNRKLKDKIITLTLQGRLQGIIMSALPFLFVGWVVSFNRNHFDIMLQTEVGRMLLFVAVGLQVVGMILIKKFSTVRI